MAGGVISPGEGADDGAQRIEPFFGGAAAGVVVAEGFSFAILVNGSGHKKGIYLPPFWSNHFLKL